jgi:streptomycin 6-kinase
MQSMLIRWQLHSPMLLHAGVESVVVAASGPSQPVVLKLLVERRAWRDQQHVLTSLGRLGHTYVPQVLDQDEPSHALLMEHVAGGAPRDVLLIDPKVRANLDRLHSAPICGHSTLAQYWAGREMRTSTRLGEMAADRERLQLAKFAQMQMRQLLRQASESVILHGDLHEGNILVTSDDVMFIDFWGLQGPAEFDWATWVVKTARQLDDPLRTLDRCNEAELRWVAALAPAEATALEYLNIDQPGAERVWQLASHLAQGLG